MLKFYTCAEKLAVYLTPYVLKCNLNIVFYYFGKDCDIENKFLEILSQAQSNISELTELQKFVEFSVNYLKLENALFNIINIIIFSENSFNIIILIFKGN